MFVSTYTPKLDEKGRFFLPPRHREQLVDGLVMARGQERCLVIYPTAGFERMVEETAASLPDIQDVRDFKRMSAALAVDTHPDKQGRISIPAELRDYANLDKDIVVTGAIDHVEVWNPQAWSDYTQRKEPGYIALNATVGLPRPSSK